MRKKTLLLKQAKLESELHLAQAAANDIQERLADPMTYQTLDATVVDQLNAEREALEQKIATLEKPGLNWKRRWKTLAEFNGVNARPPVFRLRYGVACPLTL